MQDDNGKRAFVSGARIELNFSDCGWQVLRSPYRQSGTMRIDVETGAYDGTTYLQTGTVVRRTFENFVVHTSLTEDQSSFYEYQHGSILRTLVSGTELRQQGDAVAEKKTNFFFDTAYQLLNFDFRLVLTPGRWDWENVYTLASREPFTLDLVKHNTRFNVTYNTPLVYSAVTDQMKTGQVTLNGQNSALRFEFHDTYMDVLLDADGDAVFETTTILNYRDL